MSESTPSTGAAAPAAAASTGVAASDSTGGNIREALSSIGDQARELESQGDVSEESEEQDASIEQQKTEIKALKRKLKLKVDGKEVEKEFDFSDDESMIKELQKAAAFERRAQEYSTLKKQVSEFVEQLRGNPAAILGQLGINMEELSETVLSKKVEELSKSPEQLEREKMQAELEDYKEQLESQRKNADEARLEKLKNEYAVEIETDIKEALGSGKTVLPKSPLMIRKIAEAMHLAMMNGYNNVRAADVIPVVEKQFRRELAEMFEVLPEEVLEEVVGRANIDRLRKKRLQSAKVAPPTAKQAGKQTGASELSRAAVKKDAGPKQKFGDFFDLRKL